MNVNVSLSDDLKDFLEACVASGKYASESDVVRVALRLMEQHEEDEANKLQWLSDAYRQGIESGDAGPLDAESIKAEARALRALRVE